MPTIDSSTLSNPILTAERASPLEDKALRPATLADYIGQEQFKAQLRVYLSAARKRNEPLDHTLLFGPPGLGKTTLAMIIAHEMGAGIKITSGPVLERPGDLAALLTQLSPGDVLFIDEIHRLSPVVEEVLYPAMEDGRLDILVGSGQDAKAITVDLNPFTLVGATTRAGSLTAPLLARFGIQGRLDFYTAAELSEIVQASSAKLGVALMEGAAEEVAKRSRGTPRIANRILRRVRDYADVLGCEEGSISQAEAVSALKLIGVDEHGLDFADLRMLRAMAEHHNGGPVGLETICAVVGESADTMESAIEPYLLKEGILTRTPRGRKLTERGWSVLGLTPPAAA